MYLLTFVCFALLWVVTGVQYWCTRYGDGDSIAGVMFGTSTLLFIVGGLAWIAGVM